MSTDSHRAAEVPIPAIPAKPTAAVGDAAEVEAQVQAERVRTLYRQSIPVQLANVANSVILSWLLWSEISHAWLLGWVCSMALMALARIELRRRYWRADPSPVEQDVWARRYSLGSLSAGILWGVAGFALMPSSLALQVVIVFVLGGMAAGAAITHACYLRAYTAYLLPSLLPATLRLLQYGGPEHVAMAAMLALFALLLMWIAGSSGRTLRHAFRLRFENAALLSQVSSAQASLVEANEQLLRSNEQLETRVRERTRAVQESERRLSEIVSESPDGIVVFDEEARILSANPASERILGISSVSDSAGRPLQALIGQRLTDTDLLGPAEAQRLLQLLVSVLDGVEFPEAQEFELARSDGQPAFVELALRLVRASDGRRRVHSVMRDVSERHRLHRLKQAYETRLREAERLESVGILAGGVAHDFNNLLAMILGNVDVLESAGRDPHAKALLGEIRHGSLQAAKLTKQLLAFSRKQVLDVKPTDLALVVGEARALFQRALGDDNHLAITLPEEPTVVLVDATQLEQAILNMLINARHALPDGGRVELAVKQVFLRADSDWPEAEDGAYVRLSVADNGTGMDEATRSRVFEPFFTTKAQGHGTGLGLSSVHGIVKQAGGHIRVLSELGLGTRFEVLLPSHAAAAHLGASADTGVWSPGSGTVLVVEDEALVRRSLARLLQDAGYQVEAADSAEHALSLARKCAGGIDLLVTDVIMPGMSGIELSRKLRGLNPHLAVLLVSGYAGGEIDLHRELGDLVRFLQKPFDAVSLTSAANDVLTKARAAAAAHAHKARSGLLL